MIVNTKQNPSFEFQAVEVLEYTSRPYKNKKGEDVVFNSCLLRMDGKVMKLGLVKDLDLSPYVGETVSMEFELSTWGDDLAPRISVSKIV